MDPEKVNATLEWPTPQSITEVKRVHGLVNVYKRFIRIFSGISAPLTDYTRGKISDWTKTATVSFEQLMKMLPRLLFLSYQTLTKNLQSSLMLLGWPLEGFQVKKADL